MSTNYTPGQAVIDLGVHGKLIHPVQVDAGRWYYFWDISGDGTSVLRPYDGNLLNGGNDYTSLSPAYGPPLRWTFYRDIDLNPNPDGLKTTAKFRYAELNGVKLALPLIGDQSTEAIVNDPSVTDPGYFGSRNPTGIGSSVAGQGSSASNSNYDDLLAIWDAYNGTDSAPTLGLTGTPPGWRAGLYHSATTFSISAPTSYTTFAEGHAALSLGTGEFAVSLPWSGPYNVAPGSVFGQWWTGYGFVALEVLKSAHGDTPVRTVQFSTASGSANEGNSDNTTVTVQADLDEASNQTITIPIVFSGTSTSGTDYSNAETSITIVAGQTTGSTSFTVIGDLAVESNETVILTMGTPSNAALGTNSSYTHTIINDDSDKTGPTIEITSNKAALKTGETARITFKLSETSKDFTISDIAATGGKVEGLTRYGSTYTAKFKPSTNSTEDGFIFVASDKFSDASGNFNKDGNELNNTVRIAVDTLAPTIAITSNTSALKAGSTASINFTLSEPSTDFTQADVTVSGGTLSNFSGSGTNYSATFTPTSNSKGTGIVLVMSGRFSDAAGNLNTDGANPDNRLAFEVNRAPSGKVKVSGTASPGQILSVSDTIKDADGIPTSGEGAIQYHWYADGQPLLVDYGFMNPGPGPKPAVMVPYIGKTYTIGLQDMDSTLSVVARYTDLKGMAEEVSSSPLGPVIMKPTRDNDWLIGTNGNDVINGLAGNDELYGLSGDDLLIGEWGNDLLDGGDGSDRLIGGAGSDILSGGSGVDTFVFSPGSSGQLTSWDVITDFTKGSAGIGDLIDYTAALRVGGSAMAATVTQATISPSTGIASFAVNSGTTMADALADVTARFREAKDAAGEFAFFQVNNTGNFFILISDGRVGMTATDVVIELIGITRLSGFEINGGNLTLL